MNSGNVKNIGVNFQIKHSKQVDPMFINAGSPSA